jgi:hypothetical protein
MSNGRKIMISKFKYDKLREIRKAVSFEERMGHPPEAYEPSRPQIEWVGYEQASILGVLKSILKQLKEGRINGNVEGLNEIVTELKKLNKSVSGTNTDDYVDMG